MPSPKILYLVEIMRVKKIFILNPYSVKHTKMPQDLWSLL